jgi:hypothetical protein
MMPLEALIHVGFNMTEALWEVHTQWVRIKISLFSSPSTPR